jgi:hypothetical protein
MKVTMLDIIREKLFLKKVNIYYGKDLTAYINVRNNYVISYKDHPIVVVIEKENVIDMLCLNDKDKKLISLQYMIKNQLTGLGKCFRWLMELNDY